MNNKFNTTVSFTCVSTKTYYPNCIGCVSVTMYVWKTSVMCKDCVAQRVPSFDVLRPLPALLAGSLLFFFPEIVVTSVLASAAMTNVVAEPKADHNNATPTHSEADDLPEVAAKPCNEDGSETIVGRMFEDGAARLVTIVGTAGWEPLSMPEVVAELCSKDSGETRHTSSSGHVPNKDIWVSPQDADAIGKEIEEEKMAQLRAELQEEMDAMDCADVTEPTAEEHQARAAASTDGSSPGEARTIEHHVSSAVASRPRSRSRGTYGSDRRRAAEGPGALQTDVLENFFRGLSPGEELEDLPEDVGESAELLFASIRRPWQWYACRPAGVEQAISLLEAAPSHSFDHYPQYVHAVASMSNFLHNNFMKALERHAERVGTDQQASRINRILKGLPASDAVGEQLERFAATAPASVAHALPHLSRVHATAVMSRGPFPQCDFAVGLLHARLALPGLPALWSDCEEWVACCGKFRVKDAVDDRQRAYGICSNGGLAVLYDSMGKNDLLFHLRDRRVSVPSPSKPYPDMLRRLLRDSDRVYTETAKVVPETTYAAAAELDRRSGLKWESFFVAADACSTGELEDLRRSLGLRTCRHHRRAHLLEAVEAFRANRAKLLEAASLRDHRLGDDAPVAPNRPEAPGRNALLRVHYDRLGKAALAEEWHARCGARIYRAATTRAPAWRAKLRQFDAKWVELAQGRDFRLLSWEELRHLCSALKISLGDGTKGDMLANVLACDLHRCRLIRDMALLS